MRPTVTRQDSSLNVTWPAKLPETKTKAAVIADDARAILKANRPKRAKVIHLPKPHPFEAFQFSPEALVDFQYDPSELPTANPLDTLCQRGKISRDERDAARLFASDAATRDAVIEPHSNIAHVDPSQGARKPASSRKGVPARGFVLDGPRAAGSLRAGHDNGSDSWTRMNFLEVNFPESDMALLRDICVKELPSQIIARKYKKLDKDGQLVNIGIPAARAAICDILRRLNEMYWTIEGLYSAPRSYSHNAALK